MFMFFVANIVASLDTCKRSDLVATTSNELHRFTNVYKTPSNFHRSLQQPSTQPNTTQNKTNDSQHKNTELPVLMNL